MLENRILFCGKHHLLLTRIQASGLGPMGPLVTIALNGKSRMSTRLLHFGQWEKLVKNNVHF